MHGLTPVTVARLHPGRGLTLVLYENHSTTRLQQVHDNDVTIVDLKICYLYNKSTTGRQHLQHIHNIRNMFTTVYAYGFTSSARQSHNHYKTLTTTLRLIPDKRTTITTTKLGFLQQLHVMTTSPQNSRQVYDHCVTTTLQQAHNKMSCMETRL